MASGSNRVYVYDANGMRVAKQTQADPQQPPTTLTEYVYFGGQVIAERDAATGDWSDYIFAGGRRLAKADSFEDRLWVRATHSATGQISNFYLPAPQNLAGYVVQAGDQLDWRQWRSATARGGLVILFTDQTHTAWSVADQSGQYMNSLSTTDAWVYRRVDLSGHTGKTIAALWITADSGTLAGAYDMCFQDVALVSVNGAVRTIYTRDKAMTLGHGASSGVSGQQSGVSHLGGVGWHWPSTTTYYHGDHLGSSRQMSSVDGYPVWEATYRPYGEEHAPQPTVNQ